MSVAQAGDNIPPGALDMRACRSSAFALWLVTGAGLWWLLGAFLLALTPLPAHTDSLGWTPLYWLLLAPTCVLAGLRLRKLAYPTPAG